LQFGNRQLAESIEGFPVLPDAAEGEFIR